MCSSRAGTGSKMNKKPPVCVEKETQTETPENKPSSATAGAPGASTCSCFDNGPRGGARARGEGEGRACRGRRMERRGPPHGKRKQPKGGLTCAAAHQSDGSDRAGSAQHERKGGAPCRGAGYVMRARWQPRRGAGAFDTGYSYEFRQPRRGAGGGPAPAQFEQQFPVHDAVTTKRLQI